MSFSEIWKDPVWSKVIANAIWGLFAGLVLVVTGKKRAGEYDVIKIITMNVPGWTLLAAISAVFLATSFFPALATMITLILLTAILGFFILRFRRLNTSGHMNPPEEVEEAVAERHLLFRLNDAADHYLEFQLEYYYEDNKRIGNKASGTYEFGQDKIININRSTVDGRAVVHIKRYLGNNKYRIDKDVNRNGKRVIQVVFEAKVSTGKHKLWFVAKKDGQTKWIHEANKWVEVSNTHWQPFRLHFYVPFDEDFVLFFDDRELTAPGSVQIKNLEIYEPIES